MCEKGTIANDALVRQNFNNTGITVIKNFQYEFHCQTIIINTIPYKLDTYRHMYVDQRDCRYAYLCSLQRSPQSSFK